jgi:hypothetical protein
MPFEDAHQVRPHDPCRPSACTSSMTHAFAGRRTTLLLIHTAARPASPPATPVWSSVARRLPSGSCLRSLSHRYRRARRSDASPTISVYRDPGGPPGCFSSALMGAMYSAPTPIGRICRPASRQHRKYRRFRLPTCRRRQDHRVAPIASSAAPASSCTGRRLDQPESGHDRVLQPRREPGEDVLTTTSSVWHNVRWRSPLGQPASAYPPGSHALSSLHSGSRGVKPYSVAGVVIRGADRPDPADPQTPAETAAARLPTSPFEAGRDLSHQPKQNARSSFRFAIRVPIIAPDRARAGAVATERRRSASNGRSVPAGPGADWRTGPASQKRMRSCSGDQARPRHDEYRRTLACL